MPYYMFCIGSIRLNESRGASKDFRISYIHSRSSRPMT